MRYISLGRFEERLRHPRGLHARTRHFQPLIVTLRQPWLNLDATQRQGKQQLTFWCLNLTFIFPNGLVVPTVENRSNLSTVSASQGFLNDHAPPLQSCSQPMSESGA